MNFRASPSRPPVDVAARHTCVNGRGILPKFYAHTEPELISISIGERVTFFFFFLRTTSEKELRRRGAI